MTRKERNDFAERIKKAEQKGAALWTCQGDPAPINRILHKITFYTGMLALEYGLEPMGVFTHWVFENMNIKTTIGTGSTRYTKEALISALETEIENVKMRVE